jgi:hypothetical protein
MSTKRNDKEDDTDIVKPKKLRKASRKEDKTKSFSESIFAKESSPKEITSKVLENVNDEAEVMQTPKKLKTKERDTSDNVHLKLPEIPAEALSPTSKAEMSLSNLSIGKGNPKAAPSQTFQFGKRVNRGFTGIRSVDPVHGITAEFNNPMRPSSKLLQMYSMLEKVDFFHILEIYAKFEGLILLQ